jgi:lipid II isoglutaminyl synthase (glutamine-hydrolysing)
MPKRGPSRIGSKEKRTRWQKSETTEAQDVAGHSAATGPHKAVRRRRSSLRAGLAVVSGRAAGALSRRLHLGGGTSIVGIVAERLYPDIVDHLASQLEYGSILVTGTNGKTTTSGLIAAILSDAGLRVWRNREGSNMMRGIASSLVIRALPNGRLRRSGRAISIFEVDEAVVPQALKSITPRLAVFTNLFRDQLDRFGEVDTVASRWQTAIQTLATGTMLILNADDPATAQLGREYEGPVLYYGIDASSVDLSSEQASQTQHQAIDTRTCPKCGSEYSYDMRFYSHMGHYVCTNCGLSRPQPDVRAVQVEADGFDRLRIQVETATGQQSIVVPLPGLYNIYNALAAIAVAQALQISWEPVKSGIEQFKPVFGRGERVQVEGRTVRLLLAKNPTGFNEVLRTLFSTGAARNVLFVLNDNIADGRDISWIWDVDFERIVGQVATLVVGGTRSLDLALRLKYAGLDEKQMTIIPPTPLRSLQRIVAHERERGGEPGKRSAPRQAYRGRFLQSREKALKGQEEMEAASGGVTAATAIAGEPAQATEKTTKHAGIAEAFDSAIRQTPAGETLFIVPTYTGLLEIHRLLEQRGLTPHYWEGRDE